MTWGVRVLALALLIAAARPARAEHLLLPDAHGEPDVADEAFAVTMLVRGSLARDTDVVLVSDGEPRTLREPPETFSKLGIQHLVVLDVAREDSGLRVAIGILEPGKPPDVSFVRGGDGDVAALAAGVTAHLAQVLHVRPGPIAPVSLGKLRPYAAAARDLADPAKAAQDLEDALPGTVHLLPALGERFAPLAKAPALTPELAFVVARATNTAGPLDTPGAKAVAALDRHATGEAAAILAGKPKPDALVTLAEAMLAESRSDDARMNDAIIAGLASERRRSAIAFASTVTPSRLTPEVHRALLAMVEREGSDPGAAARVGVAAAESGIDVPRALAVVSVRDAEDEELAPLEKLLATPMPAGPRLAAELAMRRGAGAEAVKIEAYARAKDELLAHRYQAWRLAGAGKQAEAAAAFQTARQPEEMARALEESGQLHEAIAAIGNDPRTPEELVIAGRLELLDHRPDDAQKTLDRAEQGAPVDPLVQRAIVDVATARHDDARAAFARRIAQLGAPAKDDAGAGSGSGSATYDITKEDLGLKTGSAEPIGEPDTDARIAAQLARILDAIPELRTLPDRKVVLAELRDKPGFLSLHVSHPDVLRPYLERALAQPPYRLTAIDPPKGFVDDEVPRDPAALEIVRLGTGGIVFYKVDTSRRVSVFLSRPHDNKVSEAAGPVECPGLVGWDALKLATIIGAGVIVLLVGFLWITRSAGEIRITIDRAPDSSDEVFCIEVTKRESRPPMGDLSKFHAETKRAGAVATRRKATLLAGTVTFRVPSGQWYVHLYGTFERGGTLRSVHESHTQRVEVRRAKTTSIAFDLVPKVAEVHVAVGAVDKRVCVWAVPHQRVYADATGQALLSLPVGRHTLTFEVDGKTFRRPIVVSAPRVMKLSLNLARELKLGAMGEIAMDSNPVVHKPRAISGFDDIPDVVHEPGAGGSGPGLADTHGVPGTSNAPPIRFADRYRVVKELGRGAMGVVHRAYDEKLEREVAIKELAAELSALPEALRMFLQEAKALAQLNHTNVVGMYDQVTDGDKVLLVMELVDGTTLESVLAERGQLPWREALAVCDQLCTGLAYAHSRHVIHRDIKPANIFIARDATVKLGDFGLARVTREVMIRKTEMRGTPIYMAPEQITGTNIDHRADLYAVGSTLFQMLCGRPPFDRGEVLFQKLHDPPPTPTSLGVQLPAGLEHLVLAMIAREATDRPASANEVRAHFKQLLRS